METLRDDNYDIRRHTQRDGPKLFLRPTTGSEGQADHHHSDLFCDSAERDLEIAARIPDPEIVTFSRRPHRRELEPADVRADSANPTLEYNPVQHPPTTPRR